MLTEADKKIIAADPSLPGLAALLDTELLLEKLRTIPALATAEKAEVRYLRYKPGNSCACTLRIRLADGSYRYYYAKALTEERFEESWRRPSRQKLVRTKHPQAPLAVFDCCIMLLHPAHDREIGHLKWLIDKEERKRLFKACSLPLLDDDGLKVDILRYKPERRLVAKVSKGRQPIAVIRCANPDEFTKMLMGNAFGVAQGGVHLLGADGTSCTLATNWQKGQSLCPEEGTPPTAELVERLAKQLTRIHRASYKHAIKYTVRDEAASLKGVVNTFRHILPEQAAWFAELVGRVEAGLTSIPERFALIHGDFSLDQVIRRENKLGETKLHILDWDRSADGNPLIDLATFQARLELQVIEGILPRRQADGILEIFLDTYRKKSGTDLDGLYWFTASAMLRLGTEPFRKRNPQWEQYILQLLQRVEEILAEAATPPVRASENHAGFPEDTLLNTLLDAPKMQVLLHEGKILPPHENIRSAALFRYKIRRRALIDYQTTGTGHLIGKYRAKGLDKRSYNVQQNLWNAGFNDRAQTGVPKTAGKLPELNTWFQHRVNGQRISSILMPQNGRLAFIGQAAARAICALHRSHVAQSMELPQWTHENELEILHDRLAKAQTVLPQWADRIANISAACGTLARQLAETPFATVHRDFYQDQILERYGRPGHMVLLDLDLLCQGHAALDAGNYIAHIRELALRLYGSADALSAHENAFLQQFLEESETARLSEVEIYTTLSLARHIYISTLFEDRKHTTETLLKLCESRLYSHPNAQ